MALDNKSKINRNASKDLAQDSSNKPLTIRDIAKMSNVGLATVSRVLNNSLNVNPLTAKRVEEVLRKTKYRPANIARALSMGKTNFFHMLYYYNAI